MKRNIAVIGLGYVGLPVAVAFAKQQNVIAFDKKEQRINELKSGYDRTEEVDSTDLALENLQLTHDPDALQQADFFIVAVPTPVGTAHRPDLSILFSASETVGQYLKSGDIIVYESTVYPGCTEEDCAPVLEKASGLKAGKDFFLAYSPERINPGDKAHRLETITKVVSGQTPEVLDIVAETYQRVVTAGVHKAPNIKTAEAAKVIENTQRDLNIALMNELALIFQRMDIDTNDVLDAAATKWNFLRFSPGLVGGHCIGVDPYYLTFQAERYHYNPEVILAGRRINDDMGKYIAHRLVKLLAKSEHRIKHSKVAILGLTFKENCPDLRNSRVVDIVNELREYGIDCVLHDPEANPDEVEKIYGERMSDWENINAMDAMILAVPHEFYLQQSIKQYQQKFTGDAILLDVKAKLDRQACEQANMTLWRL